jgi:alginate O-acetyltransferase complex protein AlgI
MLFPTTEFAIFFLLVFLLSWSLAGRLQARKLFLLGVSYFFYGYWDWRFLALLFTSSLINFLAGMALGPGGDAGRRKLIVGVAVVLNLTILGFFKYYGFFLTSLADLLASVGLSRDLPLLDIVLPIGISFFTFQGLSYVIDIYRGDIEPVKEPTDLFLYISFFPQLVAGPIVRASDFLPQLREPPRLDAATVTFGFLLIMVGLFKKMVLASYLATEIVDDVFAVPGAYSSVDLFFGAHAFVVQIYCDFSGYSDIAIGVAALLGYRFKKNFDRPLSAPSLQELWQRWHISLTSWLRDYLYRPLKGRKRGSAHMYRNLILTMMVAGLWHGAAWTFVIWGTLQGVMLVLERLIKGGVRSVRRAAEEAGPDARRAALAGRLAKWLPESPLFGWFVTINLFALTSVFFRAPDLGTVWEYFAGLAQLDMTPQKFTPFVALLIGGSIAAQFMPSDTLQLRAAQLQKLRPITAGLLLGLGLLTIEMIGPRGVAPFIYFQF